MDLELVGGPLAGRRLMTPAGVRVLHFFGFDYEGRPKLATSQPGRSPLGSYRYERAYDCARTLERVVVMRWIASASGAAGATAVESPE